jgi:predicted small lipoprotein YifL
MKKVVFTLTALALLSGVTACVGKGKAPPPGPAAPIVTRG